MNVLEFLEAPSFSNAKKLSEEITDEYGITFIQQENTYLDYKRQWPHSYSDEYFTGILRLIQAFANRYGGVIVFGVDDATRTSGFGRVKVNIEALNNKVSSTLSQAIECELFSPCLDGKYHILYVPQRKPGSMPVRQIEKTDGAKLDAVWIRKAHEVKRAESKDLSLLFPASDFEVNVQSSLPPSPATISQFVGRFEVLLELSDWTGRRREPRRFLYGKGGSGKTTIAYEFTKFISENPSAYSANDPFEIVIFVSAKSKKLEVHTGMEGATSQDFNNSRELLEAILLLSGIDASSETDEDLIDLLELLFDSKKCFICIDDIDTITTMGQDAGFDTLYLAAAKGKLEPKILYTLRNVPAQSIGSSIEVPGLKRDTEFLDFIAACARQFRVPEPSPRELDEIYYISEGRPLVAEVVIAGKKGCSTYDEALTIFKERGGDQAREYIFRREWNALGRDNRARTVLAILSILGREAFFSELLVISRYDESQLKDSISECSDMFLSVKHSEDGSSFALSEITQKFVAKARLDLPRIDFISERVSIHRKAFLPNSPKLSKLQSDYNRSIALNDLNFAQSLLNEFKADPKIFEDPRYKELQCDLFAREGEPWKAYDIFQDITKLKFLLEVETLRRLFWALNHTGAAFKERLDLCNSVLSMNYNVNIKCEFMSLKGSVYYHEGKLTFYDSPSRGLELLSRAAEQNLYSFWYHCSASGSRVVKAEEYARNTIYTFGNYAERSDMVDYFFEFFVGLDADANFYLDPAVEPLISFLSSTKKSQGNSPRYQGRLRQFKQIVTGRLKEKFEYTGSREKLIQALV